MDLIQIINNKLNKILEDSIFNNELFIINMHFFNIYNNYSNTFKTIFGFILISFFFINNQIQNNFSKIGLKKEIMNFEQYYKKCDTGILLNNVTKFKNNKKPKISIISSIYNKQNYILRFLKSIQNQNFEQIEIILIDDFSEDDTINIIENLQKDDGRIRLLKNRKNKGTLPYIV